MVIIIWFLASNSLIVAVNPKSAFLLSFEIISKILLYDLAVAFARWTSSRIIMSAFFIISRLATAHDST